MYGPKSGQVIGGVIQLSQMFAYLLSAAVLSIAQTVEAAEIGPPPPLVRIVPPSPEQAKEIEKAMNAPLPTPEELLGKLQKLEWAEFYLLAAMLETRGDLEQAGQWFYVGQIRGRAHVICDRGQDPSGAPALLASLNATVGPEVNGGLGANPDNWITVVRRALAWDEAHLEPALLSGKCRPGLDFARKDKLEMIAYIEGHKAELRAQRTKNGLSNDPK